MPTNAQLIIVLLLGLAAPADAGCKADAEDRLFIEASRAAQGLISPEKCVKAGGHCFGAVLPDPVGPSRRCIHCGQKQVLRPAEWRDAE